MTLTPVSSKPSPSDLPMMELQTHSSDALVANAAIFSEVHFIEDRLQGGWKPDQIAYFLRQNPSILGVSEIDSDTEEKIIGLAHDVASIHRVALDVANAQTDDFRPSLTVGADLVERFRDDPNYIERVVNAHAFMVDRIATHVKAILDRGGELGGLNGLGNDVQLGAFKWLADGSIDMNSPLQKEFVKDLIGRALLHDTTAGKIGQSKKEPLRTGENTPNGGWYAAFAVIALTVLLAMYMRSNAESIAPGSTGTTDSEEAAEEQALGNAEAPAEIGTEEPIDEFVEEIPSTEVPVYDQGVEELQAKFADKSKGFVVMKSDGSLVEVINETEYSIPGVYGIDDNGKLALVVDASTGDTLELEDNQWFVDEYGLVIPGYIFNYRTQQWEKIPEKNFGSGSLEEYRSNIISPEDLFNGAYCSFVKRTFPHTFVKGEYKEVERQFFGGGIVYDASTAPNFPPGTVPPFYWKHTAAYMPIQMPDGTVWEYMVLPILYPDPNPEFASDPARNVCVPAVVSLTRPHDPSRSTTGASDVSRLNMLNNDMFAPSYETSPMHPGFHLPVPFLVEVYDSIYGADLLNGKFQSFVNGNNRALNDVPTYFVIGDSRLNK